VKGFDGCSAFRYVGREVIPMTSDPRKENATMILSEHPDHEALARFVLGRLDRKAMATVVAHLRCCIPCEQVATQVPDDRLVTLLRISTTGPATESTHCHAVDSP
jgi:hypothetical protein